MASDREVEDFLTSHGPFVPPPHFREGEVFGEWRITAFLGRGGSAEVYRAVHEKSGDVVAIKVLVRATRSARVRFTEEARLLSLSPGEAFPRFHGFAERDGWPYIVEECLEPFDLPVRDREVASFLLRLCAYVGGLHARGLVHRDLKPQNIMRRSGSGEPVLIDLGLVKNAEAGSPFGKESVSVIEGRAVAVGTPGYSAPEQFTGGEVTPATDVHALGAIANACFNGKPPLFWRNIIYRATSSIPGQRYETAEALADAIRHRYRVCLRVGALLVVVGLGAWGIAFAAPWIVAPAEAPAVVRTVSKPEADTPARAEKKAASDARVLMRQIQEALLGIEGRAYRREKIESSLREAAETTETNGCKVLKVRLKDRIIKVPGQIDMSGPTCMYVIGPGTLDMDLGGSTNVTVKILNRGVLLNRSVRAYPDSGIRYVINDGCYLNFVNQDWPRGERLSHVSFGGEMAMLDYGGPTTYRDAQLEHFKSLERALLNEEKRD